MAVRKSWSVWVLVVACTPQPRAEPTAAFSPAPAYPPAPIAPASVPPAATDPAPSLDPIAVLPIEDDQLFRAERAELRAELARAIAARIPERRVLPLAEVDARLRPLSRGGNRCAYDRVDRRQRAHGAGWLATDVMHVFGGQGRPEELWVDVSRFQMREIELVAPWDPKLDVVQRYRTAFASLVRKPTPGGVLGGLAMSATRRNAVTVGTLRLCETVRLHDCDSATRDWSDRAAELSQCFAGETAAKHEVLLDGARCEIIDLDDTTGPDGRREACLCAALSKSAGQRARSGRRRIELAHEASDVRGKPRPELRVIEASTNLHADDDWHTVRNESVRRLLIDNLDALAAPLARCADKPGTALVVELELSDSGAVTSVRVLGAPKPNACVEQALRKGAFACTNDGKAARVRLSVSFDN